MKAATSDNNTKSLLEPITSKDICETLRANGELEDAIFQQLERVQVLSAMQCRLDANDVSGDLPNRLQYSQLLDDQLNTLHRLMDRYFG